MSFTLRTDRISVANTHTWLLESAGKSSTMTTEVSRRGRCINAWREVGSVYRRDFESGNFSRGGLSYKERLCLRNGCLIACGRIDICVVVVLESIRRNLAT